MVKLTKGMHNLMHNCTQIEAPRRSKIYCLAALSSLSTLTSNIGPATTWIVVIIPHAGEDDMGSTEFCFHFPVKRIILDIVLKEWRQVVMSCAVKYTKLAMCSLNIILVGLNQSSEEISRH